MDEEFKVSPKEPWDLTSLGATTREQEAANPDQLLAGTRAINAEAGTDLQETLPLAAAGSEIMRSGGASSIEDLVQQLIVQKNAINEARLGKEEAALKARDGSLTKEATVGAVLAQILPIVAGSLIAGKRGAIAGLGAGSLGGMYAVNTAEKKAQDESALLQKQAERLGKQEDNLSKDIMRAELQGFTMDQKQALAEQQQALQMLLEEGRSKRAADSEKGKAERAKDTMDQKQALAEQQQALQMLLEEGRNRRAADSERGKAERAKDNVAKKSEEKLDAVSIDIAKTEFKDYLEKEGERSLPISQLQRIKGSIEQSEGDEAAVVTLAKDWIGRVLPNTDLGDVVSLKQAASKITLEAGGSLLSRATEPDVEKVAADIGAKMGNSKQQFARGLDVYTKLLFKDALNRRNDMIEYLNNGMLPKNLASRIPSVDELLTKYGYKSLGDTVITLSNGSKIMPPKPLEIIE